MPQVFKDALYLAIVIILAIIMARIIWQMAVLILLLAGGYFLYQKFIKDDDNIFR